MKGLILKDLYLIKGFAKQYVIVLAFMTIWAIAMKAMSFLGIYFILMGAMILLSVMSLDDAVSFNRFALTMPISERTLIQSKYLIFILTVSAGGAIALIISGIVSFLPVEMNQEFGWREIMPSLTLFVVATSIAFPVIWLKGAEKGRYAYMVAILGLGGIVYVAAKACLKYNISLDALETLPNALFVGVFACICMIALLISYFVSVFLVRKKDW